MIKIGIAGVRGLGGMQGLVDTGEVEVTAMCDLNEERLDHFTKEYNIPHKYRVYEDMLESDIDAVIVGTPMQCHVPQAIAALQAGKHVMSEVVAGISMDELYWLKESVEKSGKIYMFAENYCYMPQNQLIKELSLQGYFGDIYYAEGEYLHNIDEFIWYEGGKPSWRQYWQLGKHGSFYPTHSLGPVMQCMPGERIAEISTFSPGNYRNNPNLRQEDGTTTMCVTESGKLIKIRVDCMSHRPPNMDYYLLQGTKGAYESRRGLGDEEKIAIATEEDPMGYEQWKSLWDYKHLLPERYRNATESQLKAGHSGGDFFIMKDFVDAIKTNTQPELDVYKACEWTAVGILSELSVVNKGKTMQMPKFGPKGVGSDDYIIKL